MLAHAQAAFLCPHLLNRGTSGILPKSNCRFLLVEVSITPAAVLVYQCTKDAHDIAGISR